ncbi:MAG: magnesium transporter CorA family protein [Acetobacteraceae bacterium]|nr:magnesium transporter CorA family protein [Acetobacteraceae bacterium]
MLMLDGHRVDDLPTALPGGAVWIDLLDGTPEEISWVEQHSGFHIPDRAELSEIESSSRLRTEANALYLTTPVVFRDGAGMSITSPLGFVLSKSRLITVRFEPLTAFKTFAAVWSKPDAQDRGSQTAFVGVMDAIVDRIADVLEMVGSELDDVSHHVFSVHKGGPPAREDANLRAILRQIGRCGDIASKIRDSLLGVARIVPYVLGQSAEALPPALRLRLETQRADISSLNDYNMHLTNKVQLLLDATLGLINIEQNNIIKVLTVVSVVGVPPTLVASMYGMNFHDMPELSWTWGYQYGLALIVLSAVCPIIWFKLRGWL